MRAMKRLASPSPLSSPGAMPVSLHAITDPDLVDEVSRSAGSRPILYQSTGKRPVLEFAYFHDLGRVAVATGKPRVAGRGGVAWIDVQKASKAQDIAAALPSVVAAATKARSVARR